MSTENSAPISAANLASSAMGAFNTALAERPRLRGRMHLAAAAVSLVGLFALVHAASTPTARLAAWVYGIAAVALYLTSGTYHVFTRTPRARRIMQRADHSMIYVLIAGTFTPTALLLLDGPWRVVALVAMWTGALAGVLVKLIAFDRLAKVSAALYIVLGWSALAALPAMLHRPGLLALVVAGGLLYTVGAILFSLKRPNPFPRWFGYHEVWHSFGVAAGALLFVANLGLIRAA